MSSDPGQRIIDYLSLARRVLVTTHVSPDGDALGCCAAAVLALRQKSIDSQVLLLSHLPRKYEFIFTEHSIPFVDAEKGLPADFSLHSFDCLLVLDTGTWSQLPTLRPPVENWSAPKLIIDHHLTQETWGDVRLVDPTAAATGEIVHDLLVRWGIGIDHAIAEALYLAIITDTGWFQFSNTRPQTLRRAAALMEVGVDTDKMHKALYQNEHAARVRLQTRAMQSLDLQAQDRLAVMTLTTGDFAASGASLPDTENLINLPLQIASVEVSILVTENLHGGPTRISLRSKGAVDVSKLAEQFGGGGHARAAGMKIEAPLAEARARVIQAVLPLFSRPDAP